MYSQHRYTLQFVEGNESELLTCEKSGDQVAQTQSLRSLKQNKVTIKSQQ